MVLPSTALRVSVVVLYSIIFVASLAGNTLFLYIIWRKPYTRTSISFLFINMAVADLLITIFVVPNSVAFYFRDRKWIDGAGGELICRLQIYLFTVSIAADIFTLTVMAFDRFMAVMHPLRSRRCCGHAMCTLGIWLSSTIVMLPTAVVWSSRQGNCGPDWSFLGEHKALGSKAFYTMILVVFYLIPFALMGLLYSLICHKLWRQKRPGIVTEHSRRCARDQGRRVVIMLVTILLVFALCWFPMHAYHMIVWSFPPEHLPNPPLYAMFLCFWAGHAHSAINPWMYMSLNTNFRLAFFSVVLRRPEISSSSALFTKSRVPVIRNTAV